MTSGTVFAQAVMVLALPILTRLYAPADFSVLAVYVALVAVVSVVACFRYNIAIPLPQHDEDALALLAIALMGAGLVSLLVAVPILIAPEATAGFLGHPALETLLWMVPVGVFIAASYDALQYWALRRKRFALVTRTRIVRAIGGAGSQLGIGAFAPSPFGLVFGHMIYGGLGIWGLLRNFLRNDGHLLRSVDARRMRIQAREFRRFPVYSVPEALFNTASVEVSVILIAALVAGPEAGYLFLAMRVMGLPMALVGSAVAQVYFAEAPAKLRDGTLSAFTYRTMWTLLKTGAPPLIVVAGVSPFLFPLVFGPEWERAGWLVVWMTPWFILQFVASPVSMVVHVMGRQRLAAGLQAVGMVLRVGSVLAASHLARENIVEAFVLSGIVFYGLYLLAVVSLVMKNDHD